MTKYFSEMVGNKSLKLFRFKRLTLLIILICSGTLLALSAGSIYLYHSNDVEILVKNYPYYDLKKHEYKLTHIKPKDWTAIKDISQYAKWAIIVSEDWAFYEHNGLDLFQIKKAIKQSIKEEELVRGASTITQQVVKNTILTNERSLWRKFREAILSYKIEHFLTKNQILEIYLNIIELGDGVYGINKASYYYFQKAPRYLTAREGAFLAMLLPSPKKYSISFRKKELTPFANEIIESILIKLRQADIYTEEERLIEREKKFFWEKSIEIEPAEVPEHKDIEDSEFLDYEVYEE